MSWSYKRRGGLCPKDNWKQRGNHQVWRRQKKGVARWKKIKMTTLCATGAERSITTFSEIVQSQTMHSFTIFIMRIRKSMTILSPNKWTKKNQAQISIPTGCCWITNPPPISWSMGTTCQTCRPSCLWSRCTALLAPPQLTRKQTLEAWTFGTTPWVSQTLYPCHIYANMDTTSSMIPRRIQHS